MGGEYPKEEVVGEEAMLPAGLLLLEEEEDEESRRCNMT